METSIGQRIRHKRKEFGWTQQELAKKLKDVSHVAISQWESNTTKPNAENLYELSQILGCDFGWLLKGEGENTNVLFLADPENKKIPILEITQLEHWHIGIDIPTPIEREYLMSNIHNPSKCFALKVLDDSMKPDFVEGDMIVIDSEQKPAPGEFVVARVDKDILFRKYQVESSVNGEAEYFSLTPLNQDFPPFSSSRHSIELLGTMVEHRIFRRKR